MKTDVLKILGKIIPTAIFVLLLPFSIIYMAISVSTQFRASPFERALFSALNRVLLIN